MRCSSCGELLVADLDTARSTPAGVVPFQIERDQVRTALNTWRSSRWLAPTALSGTSAVADAEGIYLPYWVSQADTHSRYEGRRGDNWYETVTSTTTDANGNSQTRSEQVRHTNWRRVSGEVSQFFSGMVLSGCTLIGDDLPNWNFADAVPYQETHLREYRAVQYNRGSQTAEAAAREKMDKAIHKECKRAIGGDEQRVGDITTDYRDARTELVLVPAWFLTYTFRNRTWSVLVNGATGAAVGERPYSVVKILALLAVIAVVVAVVTVFLKYH